MTKESEDSDEQKEANYQQRMGDPGEYVVTRGPEWDDEESSDEDGEDA